MWLKSARAATALNPRREAAKSHHGFEAATIGFTVGTAVQSCSRPVWLSHWSKPDR